MKNLSNHKANFYFVKENEIGDFNFFINHQVNHSSRNSLFFIIDKSIISQKVNPFNYFKKMQVDLFKILGNNEFKFLKNLTQINRDFNRFMSDIVPYGTFTNETKYQFDIQSNDIHFSYEKKILIIFKLIFLINKNSNKSINIFINDDLESFSFDYRSIFREHLISSKTIGELNIFTNLNNYLTLGSITSDSSQKIIQLYRDNNNRLNEKEILTKFNKKHLYEFTLETDILNINSKPIVLIPNIKYKHLLDKKFLQTHTFLVYVDLTHLNYFLRILKELGLTHRTKLIYYELNKSIELQIQQAKISNKKIAKNEKIEWITYEEALSGRVSAKWRNSLNLEPINYFIDDRLYNKTKVYDENETIEKVAKLNKKNSKEETLTKPKSNKKEEQTKVDTNSTPNKPISSDDSAKVKNNDLEKNDPQSQAQEFDINESFIDNFSINLNEINFDETATFDKVTEHNINTSYTGETEALDESELDIEVFEPNTDQTLEADLSNQDQSSEEQINIDKILIEEITQLSVDDLAKINLLNQNNLLSIALTERLNHYTKEYEKQVLLEDEVREVVKNTLGDFLKTTLIKNNMPKQKRVKSNKKSSKRWNK